MEPGKWFKLLVAFSGKDSGKGTALSVGRAARALGTGKPSPPSLSLSPRTGLARPSGWEELP